MALPAYEVTTEDRRPKLALRGKSVALLLTVTASLIAIATVLPPFVPTRADLADPHQALYASAIWPETQVSLAVLMIFLPALVYAVTTRGAFLGRLTVGSFSLLGTAVATFYLITSLNSYMAGPVSASGMVTYVDKHRICVEAPATSQIVGAEPWKHCFALGVPAEELRDDSDWVKDKRAVLMLVSPRDHVGYVEPISGSLQGGG